jgi:hypothetical protein
MNYIFLVPFEQLSTLDDVHVMKFVPVLVPGRSDIDFWSMESVIWFIV